MIWPGPVLGNTETDIDWNMIPTLIIIVQANGSIKTKAFHVTLPKMGTAQFLVRSESILLGGKKKKKRGKADTEFKEGPGSCALAAGDSPACATQRREGNSRTHTPWYFSLGFTWLLPSSAPQPSAPPLPNLPFHCLILTCGSSEQKTFFFRFRLFPCF